MGNVETRDLGDVGRAYICGHLADTNEFCAALLQTFIAEPGEVFTIAPAGTPDARLAQFNQGGLLSENCCGRAPFHCRTVAPWFQWSP
jgi:hypothetical protein